MYTSSDGTKKDPKEMNSNYIINGLVKCSREIFNSKNEEEYNKYIENITVLYNELLQRFDSFLVNKIDKEWKE